MGKTLYIIAGCNGAGKTTASISILPELLDCKEFVNADEIARGLSPFNPEGVAIEAGRLMLERIDILIKGNESFSIETTLSTKSYSRLIKKAHANGFKTRLIFFWLPSPEYAIMRVAQRVQEGGHNITTEVILRRYHSGITNLFDIYLDIVDEWMIIENLHTPSLLIADGSKDTPSNIYHNDLYLKLKSYVRRK